MDLIELLLQSGGKDSIGEIAGTVGLDKSKANDLIGAIAPALMTGLMRQSEPRGGLSNLEKALARGNHQRYIEQPELMRSDSTRKDGNKILGHIFGSKDVSRNVAAEAAGQTGLDVALIKKALPLIAGLAMGALSKKTAGATRASGDGLAGLLGGMLGSAGATGDVDDLIGLARRLF